MSRRVKYICDGCGKEIEKNPIRLQAEHVDAETGDFSMGAKGYYWENGKKDYCENCMAQIIHFVDGLPTKNAEKVTVPNPDFENEDINLTPGQILEIDKDYKALCKEMAEYEAIISKFGCYKDDHPIVCMYCPDKRQCDYRYTELL